MYECYLTSTKATQYVVRSFYEPTLRLAAHEGWIVCVPRRGTFTKNVLYKEDVEEHILIPDYDMSKTSFRSLSNKNVKLLNRILTINYETPNSYPLRLLFEETFYNEDSWKYRICEGDIHLANYYLGWSNQNEQIVVRSDLCHPLCCCERCAPIHEYSEKRNKIPAIIFNSYNNNGETILHVASTVGSLEIIQLLLDAGADVNVTTKFEGRTPLHLACSANKIQAVKIILDCAACNINAKDLNGDTPLHLATKNVDTKLMELLIRSGANANIRNLQNVTPRSELEKQMSKEIALKILKCNSLEYPSHYFSGID
ncbi:hypothetical protein HZH66_004834 [Vespula vulgaris]|uniref:Uncharacterized protein n=1 Tax=Vespula vulgaris TaxID=7454 RepID=A0A834KAX2_VESVU|nr:hypothetical protein HZH66_004834 [Vespula vulgaris]